MRPTRLCSPLSQIRLFKRVWSVILARVSLNQLTARRFPCGNTGAKRYEKENKQWFLLQP
jgi:hypothetical protein